MRYELKGSTHKRKAKKDEAFDKTMALKDLDLLNDKN
jgi:hypothetical protein